MCDNQYKIYWWEATPYLKLFNNSNSSSVLGSATGIIVEVIDHLFMACCEKRLSAMIREKKEFDTMADSLKEFAHGSGNVIALPVLTETSSLSVAPPDFVRVLEAPGMVHIERRIMRSILIELIGTIWPMMIGVLLSAGFAGVVIWLLEIRVKKNRAFRHQFATGVFQGYWYSFITMLTVGYGDKVPRSIPGKIFGMIWALVGVTIMGLFTATVTNFLSSVSTNPEGLRGVAVVVVNGSLERHLVLQEGGIPIEVENFSMQYELLENCIDWNKTIRKQWNTRYIMSTNSKNFKHSFPNSIAIDHYRFLHDYKKFDDRFYVNVHVTDPVTIGFLLTGPDLNSYEISPDSTKIRTPGNKQIPLTTNSLLSCMKRHSFIRRNYLDQIIRKSLHHTNEADDDEEHDISTKKIMLKDVLLLKPEHLKKIVIASTGLLISFVIIVGLGDWIARNRIHHLRNWWQRRTNRRLGLVSIKKKSSNLEKHHSRPPKRSSFTSHVELLLHNRQTDIVRLPGSQHASAVDIKCSGNRSGGVVAKCSVGSNNEPTQAKCGTRTGAGAEMPEMVELS